MAGKKKKNKNRDCRKIRRCMDCLLCVSVCGAGTYNEQWWCKQYNRTVYDTHTKPEYCGIEWIIIISKGGEENGK